MPPNDLSPLRAELALDTPSAGPKGARTLRARQSDLAPPAHQLAALAAAAPDADFSAGLAGCGRPSGLDVAAVEILQINIGRLCNMTCRHCHVDAGPDRVAENMDERTVQACIALLDRLPAHTVDITGGAPELNPHFRALVDACVARGRTSHSRHLSTPP